jgi:hypothetical protein
MLLHQFEQGQAEARVSDQSIISIEKMKTMSWIDEVGTPTLISSSGLQSSMPAAVPMWAARSFMFVARGDTQ